MSVFESVLNSLKHINAVIKKIVPTTETVAVDRSIMMSVSISPTLRYIWAKADMIATADCRAQLLCGILLLW